MDHERIERTPRERTLGLRARLRSVACALWGIVVMLRTQPNAWIHALATLVVVAAGLALGITRLEWCALVLALLAVWVAEALNTALELLTDLASPAFHPLAGRVKDVAAGAVLLAALGAIVVGALVFWPYVSGRVG